MTCVSPHCELRNQQVSRVHIIHEFFVSLGYVHTNVTLSLCAETLFLCGRLANGKCCGGEQDSRPAQSAPLGRGAQGSLRPLSPEFPWGIRPVHGAPADAAGDVPV